MSVALPPRPTFAFAKRHGATLVDWRNGRAHVAHRGDVRVETLAELRRYLGAPLELEPLDDGRYTQLLRELYEQGGADARAMVDSMDAGEDLGAIADALPEPEDLLESDDDAVIIRLINALLTEAVKENASDIHIEPFENRLVVRFRVDGVLREVLQSKRAVAPLVVSRIKVMSRLDIAVKDKRVAGGIVSNFTVTSGCVCKMEAGANLLTGPSRQALTAAAFRSSGTMQRIFFAFKICRMDIEIACWGTSARFLNQPSPTCWRRHASSSLTTIYGCSVSKFAGGSLNARCPFSPIPTKARSTGFRLNSAPTR